MNIYLNQILKIPFSGESIYITLTENIQDNTEQQNVC